MTIEITTSPHAPRKAARSVATAMVNGLKCRCPACGTGAIYGNYLKVNDHCPACGEALHHQRADDAPPYFTMVIVGHLVVGGVLSLERAVAPSMLVQMAVWLPMTVVLSLLLLPRVKGGLIGLQWALGMHGFGPGPDPSEPDPIDGQRVGK